jgi:hypothetical protein
MVNLTVGCGFCYPPCYGPMGDRSGTCMPRKALPPESFPISLVPIEKAPRPRRCGPNATCSPRASGPPRRPPFTPLGEARPRTDEDGRNFRDNPRYLLRFSIPDLRPGIYAFVIYCETCLRGKSGSLIAAPTARPWRLRVLPSNPKATID